MVKIAEMPAQHLIDGWKGTIDFFIYKGQPVARSWPHWHPRKPTEPELQAQIAFGYVNQMAHALPPYIIDQYRRMAASSQCSWKDIFVRGYLYGSRHR